MNISNAKITVTGGSGFLGTRVVAELIRRGASPDRIFVPRSKYSDLRRMDSALAAARHQDLVIHLAGNVGGIGKNQREPYTLWSDNLRMGMNLLDACVQERIAKLVIIGTICEYPKYAPVPFRESDLWNGYPEETNAPYGIAKKALLVGGQAAHTEHGLNVVHLLPVNLYGPGDNFDPSSSHVIPALIRKVAEAKKSAADHITVWGTGTATREFLYVDDAAEGIVTACDHYDGPEPVNLGSGREISILDLTHLIAELMGFTGQIETDPSKPDGQPRRRLSTERAVEFFDWQATTALRQGLEKTITWYLSQR